MPSLLPWQQQDWVHLQAYAAQQRIPQALLVSGKKGLGKQHFVNQFAYSLLCAKPHADGLACGQCHSCVLLNAETHPDYIVVKPDGLGKSITVDQIRGVIVRLTLKPQFDGYRVVIVNPADAMNTNAANAFLKCLEEPAGRTVIILISERAKALPATIVSRCQKMALTMPDRETVLAWLQQQKPGLSPCDIEILLDLAQLAPLLALQFANDETLNLRNTCFSSWMAIAQRRSHPVIVAEQWQKLPGPSLIFWMTSWVIDMIKCGYQAGQHQLYNPDLNKPLQALAQRLELKGLYQWYDLLLVSRQRLQTPINKQSLLEEILIQWLQLNQSTHHGRITTTSRHIDTFN
ncbi:MAG: DNA polymerase III subunit delta' [Methylovulum sp.]|nr:DNA polymerase III subunit delta' [Methylovulum sp.]